MGMNPNCLRFEMNNETRLAVGTVNNLVRVV
jgi:hypothetical protein